jgi:3-oxoacyl-[acyl-carrier-protein] synthase II
LTSQISCFTEYLIVIYVLCKEEVLKAYITGYGIFSSLGNSPNDAFASLLESKTGVRFMDEWSQYPNLHAKLAAPVVAYDNKAVLPRQVRRTMSPMSEMSALATFQALEMAGIQKEQIDSNKTLLTIGSTTGSPGAMEEYFQKSSAANGLAAQPGTGFFKVMNHSVASNVAVAIGFNGAVISPSSACATSAQAAIMGWELIQSGLYDMVICGGADELHHLSSSVFDNVYAASRGYSDHPELSPRPFDKKRDGLVVSEGASILILENEKSLIRRGLQSRLQSFPEFVSGAYLCESSHMSQSNSQQMVKTMSLAMERGSLTSSDIEYINAHATGTLQGDGQECSAIAQIFKDTVPVSSLKGHFGHSMAACGLAEIIMSLKMMESGILIGTRNLDEVADDCQGVLHLKSNKSQKINTVLSNNFAFGGINTSLIVRST